MNNSEIFEKLRKAQEDRQEKTNADILTWSKKLIPFFMEYEPIDLLKVLFTIELWLPNISSIVKMTIAYNSLIAIPEEAFTGKRRISFYSDFEYFFNKFIQKLPDLSLLEDFIPDQDWGEIYFQYKNKFYQFLLGGARENSYNTIQYILDLGVVFKDELLKEKQNNPNDEIKIFLSLQDQIIKGINTNEKKDIENGHIEVPPSNFWQQCKKVFNSTSEYLTANEHSIKSYITEFENFPTFEHETFLNPAGRNGNAPISDIFLKYKDKIYLLHPRNCNDTFIVHWNYNFNFIGKCIKNESILKRVNYHFGFYISQFLKHNYLILPAAADEKFNPKHEPLSAFVFSNEKAYLFITFPYYSEVSPETLEAFVEKTFITCNEMMKSYDGKLRIGNYYNGDIVGFKDDDITEIIPIIISPHPEMKFFIKKGEKAVFICGTDLYAVLQNVNSFDVFNRFISFYHENNGALFPGNTWLDILSAFNLSDEVLVDGATQYHRILIEPNSGSSFIYSNLKTFWDSTPKVYLDYPSFLYNFELEYGKSKLCKPRGKQPYYRCIKIFKAYFILSNPSNEISDYLHGLACDLFEQTIIFYLNKFNKILSNIPLLKRKAVLNIGVFTEELVQGNNKYTFFGENTNSVNHFKFKILETYDKTDIKCVIIVNPRIILEKFSNVQNNTYEIELFLDFVHIINIIEKSTKIKKVVRRINLIKGKKQNNFCFYPVDKNVAFPEFLKPWDVETRHYKKARKTIAQIVKENSIEPGVYSDEDGNQVIRRLQNTVVSYLDKLINQHNVLDVIPKLIEQIDINTHDKELIKHRSSKALTHQVSYDPVDRFGDVNSSFISLHKNIRYLIEKTLSIMPNGNKKLGKEEFGYWVGIADWMHSLYDTSDNLHYKHVNVEFSIDKDYKPVSSIGDIDTSLFKHEQSKERLGVDYKSYDDDLLSIKSDELSKELDECFMSELGFRFSTLLVILDSLSKWTIENEDGCYSAKIEDILNKVKSHDHEFDEKESMNSIEYITLRNDEILKLFGSEKHEIDIPVWEFRKRTHRYIIRPLILINDTYYWGAWSTYHARLRWGNYIINGNYPFELDSKSNIKKLMAKNKKLIESKLSGVSFSVINNFTEFCELELDLEKRFPKNNYPQVGDYDVFSYLPEINTILLIECKYNLPVYTIKDDRRRYREVFEGRQKRKSHVFKIHQRHQFVENNWERIFSDLGWESLKTKPFIKSVYITKELSWWMTENNEELIEFLSIGQFENYIHRMLK